MSHKLISHNADLKRLRDEGYEIEIVSAHLMVSHIPYVNSNRQIEYGILVAPLGDLAGEKTTRPSDHVIHFVGNHPCDSMGNVLVGIQNASGQRTLGVGVVIDHSFSNKPSSNWPSDYYEKVVHYERLITGHARVIDPNVTAKTFKPISTTDDPETVFNYIDTNSSRAEIGAISDVLKNEKLAIVGLGGTGSYVLDLVAKCPVAEIHLFDGDDFLSHNAFRSPGAASLEELHTLPKKVQRFAEIYGKLHKKITPHAYHVTSEVLNELSNFTFVFLCIDGGPMKKEIVGKLLELRIPFIDTGIGVYETGGRLTGSVSVTTTTPEKNDHLSKYISFADTANDIYKQNIQISETNALAAILAVIKWKKLRGFYHDLMKEFNTVYDTNMNSLNNHEIES